VGGLGSRRRGGKSIEGHACMLDPVISVEDISGQKFIELTDIKSPINKSQPNR
jgi:hypothetical protein